MNSLSSPRSNPTRYFYSTESLKDYSRKPVRQAYASLDDFLPVWNDAVRKQTILDELARKGVSWKNWPHRSAAITTPSIWSATSPSTRRR